MAANGTAPPTHVDTVHRIRPATHSCAIYTFYTSFTPPPFHFRLSRLWIYPIKLQEFLPACDQTLADPESACLISI